MTETPVVPSWRTVWRLNSYVRRHMSWLVLGVVVAMGEAVLDVAIVYFLKHLTDSALASQSAAFKYYIVLLGGAVGLGLLLTYLSRISVTRIAAYTVRDVRNHLTRHLQYLPLSRIEQYHSGDLVSRLNSDANRLDKLIGGIPQQVYQPLLFAGASVYMFTLSWKLLLASFVLVPVSMFVSDRLSKPVERHSRAQRAFLADGNVVAQDTISGMAIVKAFQLQSLLIRRYLKAMIHVQHKGMEIARIDSYQTLVWLILRFTPQLVLPIYGSHLIMQDELTVGGLLACITLMWYMVLPLESFLTFVKEMRETAPAAERLWQISDHRKEHDALQAFVERTDTEPVRFDLVAFKYDHEVSVLKGLTFTVPLKKTTALIGPSGCGKSTVLKLLCGFHEPQEGSITLYGNDLRQVSLTDVRARLSLVSQDTYLFSTTIGENIGYGRRDATPEDIEAAARAANAHGFIRALPRGYDTPVGERGIRLSGGQRQRIAIARALLKDAPVLLLDEPTAALDAEAESVVEEALNRLMTDRTVLIIAHRLSAIRNADRLLVLDQGQIIEQGTHDALLQTGSVYKNLYLKQISDNGNQG